MRDGNRSKYMDISQMICLCYIIDDYEDFKRDLDELLECEDSRNMVASLHLISNGIDNSLSNKVRKFYKKNKKIIDMINSFTNISFFINDNYDLSGNFSCVTCLESFYNYIVIHKDKLDHIVSLLRKISDLGFKKLCFDESLDFTGTNFEVFYNFEDNFDIVFLDNMEAISSYQPNVVNYKSTFSNYRIVLRQSNSLISSFDRKISVNSLLFEFDRLPLELSRKCIFDYIISLVKNKSNDFAIIRDYVDLSVHIDDLCRQFGFTSSVIQNLKSVDDKSELIRILSTIRNGLCELRSVADKCCCEIVDGSSSLTLEQLELEKKNFIKRRHLNK